MPYPSALLEMLYIDEDEEGVEYELVDEADEEDEEDDAFETESSSIEIVVSNAEELEPYSMSELLSRVELRYVDFPLVDGYFQLPEEAMLLTHGCYSQKAATASRERRQLPLPSPSGFRDRVLLVSLYNAAAKRKSRYPDSTDDPLLLVTMENVMTFRRRAEEKIEAVRNGGFEPWSPLLHLSEDSRESHERSSTVPQGDPALYQVCQEGQGWKLLLAVHFEIFIGFPTLRFLMLEEDAVDLAGPFKANLDNFTIGDLLLVYDMELTSFARYRINHGGLPRNYNAFQPKKTKKKAKKKNEAVPWRVKTFWWLPTPKSQEVFLHASSVKKLRSGELQATVNSVVASKSQLVNVPEDRSQKMDELQYRALVGHLEPARKRQREEEHYDRLFAAETRPRLRPTHCFLGEPGSRKAQETLLEELSKVEPVPQFDPRPLKVRALTEEETEAVAALGARRLPRPSLNLTDEFLFDVLVKMIILSQAVEENNELRSQDLGLYELPLHLYLYQEPIPSNQPVAGYIFLLRKPHEWIQRRFWSHNSKLHFHIKCIGVTIEATAKTIMKGSPPFSDEVMDRVELIFGPRAHQQLHETAEYFRGMTILVQPVAAEDRGDILHAQTLMAMNMQKKLAEEPEARRRLLEVFVKGNQARLNRALLVASRSSSYCQRDGTIFKTDRRQGEFLAVATARPWTATLEAAPGTGKTNAMACAMLIPNPSMDLFVQSPNTSAVPDELILEKHLDVESLETLNYHPEFPVVIAETNGALDNFLVVAWKYEDCRPLRVAIDPAVFGPEVPASGRDLYSVATKIYQEQPQLLHVQERNAVKAFLGLSEESVERKTFGQLFKAVLRVDRPTALVLTPAVAVVLLKGELLSSSQISRVLIDEASCLRTSTFLAIRSLLPNTPFLVVGDPKQSAPYDASFTVRSTILRLFSPCSIFDLLLNCSSTVGVRLENVYRHHPELVKFWAAAGGYEGLQPMARAIERDLAQQVLRFPNNKLPFVLIAGEGRAEQQPSASHLNESEAATAARIVMMAIEKGLPPTSILVVALYTAQASLLRQHLETQPEVRVGTAAGNQGKEADLVVACLTRTSRDESFGYNAFFDDRRMANVLMTRARCGLVLLADPDMFKGEDFEYSYWMDLLRVARSRRAVMTPKEFWKLQSEESGGRREEEVRQTPVLRLATSRKRKWRP